MTNFNNLTPETRELFTSIVIDTLKDRYEASEIIDDLSELHFKAFNEDYFIIGYYEAENFAAENGGAFNLIGIVKEYEEDHFGELTTDISNSEKAVNMFAYIVGEEVIYNLEEGKTAGELIEELEA